MDTSTSFHLTDYSKLSTHYAGSERSSVSRLPSLTCDDLPLLKGSTNHDERSTGRRQSGLWLLAWWMPELVATLLSVALFVSIVAILRRSEGRGITEVDLPHNVTLNGFIAALATLNRAFLVAPLGSALMQELWLFYAAESRKENPSSRLIDLKAYHEASQNAFGAMKYLIRRRQPRPLAYTAALAIVASLGFSTTLQQVVTFTSLVPVHAGSSLMPGNLPRSESWTAVHGSSSDKLNVSYPPFELIAAIYDGVLGGNVSPLKAPCPSGNCTWPLTPSLGVCGACSATTFTEECYDACPPSVAPSDCKKLPKLMCNYTLASGSRASLFNFSYPEPKLWPGFQVVSGQGARYHGPTDKRLYIANFDMIGAPYVPDPGDYYKKMEVEAWECGLWMCVQSYNTTVTSTEHLDVVATIQDQQTKPYTFPPVNVSGHQPIKFNVSQHAVETLARYFNRSFNGVASLDQSTAELSSDLIAGVWNGTRDPQGWIDNVATSMTNVIRVTNSSIRTEFDGKAYQLGVSVRWLWLVLPAILVASSVLLLGTVMARTAYSDVGAWRGSPLTLLLLKVDQRFTEAGSRRLDEYHGPERAIGKERVRLVRSSDGSWALDSC
ncbi:hypothetical protein LTR10_006192 [Elasticomyces elasticus]|nr:hypothetical protein LTR10_006192 [Elasticomyces elasticus]KAK4966758.1 hypothetical protein LTR42_011069 [Elasticomyces elasticus]